MSGNNNTKRKSWPKPLPFSVYEAARHGVTEAMASVVRHYESYIVYMSRRRHISAYGVPRYFVDEDIRQQIEAELMLQITHFDPSRVK